MTGVMREIVLLYSKAPKITFLVFSTRRTEFRKLCVKYKKIALVITLVIGIENTFSAQK